MRGMSSKKDPDGVEILERRAFLIKSSLVGLSAGLSACGFTRKNPYLMYVPRPGDTTDCDGDGVEGSRDYCPDDAPAFDHNLDGCGDVCLSIMAPSLFEVRNEPVPVPNTVFFAHNSDALSKEAQGMLDQVVMFMRFYPETRLMVVGHADPSAANPQDLSTRRAEAVQRYIAGQGVRNHRFDVRALGATHPLPFATAGTVCQERNDRVTMSYAP